MRYTMTNSTQQFHAAGVATRKTINAARPLRHSALDTSDHVFAQLIHGLGRCLMHRADPVAIAEAAAAANERKIVWRQVAGM